MSRRRSFLGIAFVATLGLGLSRASRSQEREQPRRIGVLYASSRADAEYFVGLLRTELEKLGWVGRRQVQILEVRSAEGSNDRLPSLAAALVAEAPDVILVQSGPATRACMEATKSIPIVMIGVGNPVEYGIIESLAKPGGNVTGSSYLTDESTRKTLALLKETIPQLRSVAFFVNPTNEAAAASIKLMHDAALAHGLRMQVVEVAGPSDLGRAFAAIRHESTESILLPPEPFIRSNRETIGNLARTHRLPIAVVGPRRYLPHGGLLSFGPTSVQYGELSARYVDRILKGAKPADLAVEEPARFELAISRKTADALGLTIPRSIEMRAEIID